MKYPKPIKIETVTSDDSPNGAFTTLVFESKKFEDFARARPGKFFYVTIDKGNSHSQALRLLTGQLGRAVFETKVRGFSKLRRHERFNSIPMQIVSHTVNLFRGGEFATVRAGFATSRSRHEKKVRRTAGQHK